MTLAPARAEAAIKVSWRPDETLFGLLSRHHFLNGRLGPQHTCLELFGQHALGVVHDFPGYVDQLVSRTQGRLGDAFSLIFRRTLVPYFLPFRSADAAQSAISALRNGPCSSVKTKLGMLTSGLCASNPLKACRKCMSEDVEGFRSAYWHRDHQWPGSLICARHNEVLLYARGKIYVGKCFDWLLPHDLEFAPCAEVARATTSPFLQKLTTGACALGNLPAGTHFAPSVLSYTYRKRLIELDLSRPNGRLRYAGFATCISQACEELVGVNGFEALFRTGRATPERFESIVHGDHPTAQPIAHLIVISALFDSWDAFALAYASSLSCSGDGAMP